MHNQFSLRRALGVSGDGTSPSLLPLLSELTLMCTKLDPLASALQEEPKRHQD